MLGVMNEEREQRAGYTMLIKSKVGVTNFLSLVIEEENNI